MPITAKAPGGGIVSQLGGESRPLVLRNREIERFEDQHAPFGVFELIDQLLGSSTTHPGHRPPQVRHCRDIVALALVGGGAGDLQADQIIDAMGPGENTLIRAIAQDVLFAAFVPPEDKKKPVEPAGSSTRTARKTTRRKPKSKAPASSA